MQLATGVERTEIQLDALKREHWFRAHREGLWETDLLLRYENADESPTGEERIVCFSGSAEEIVTVEQLATLKYDLVKDTAAALVDMSPYTIENYAVNYGVYPTETAMTNLGRVIGFADSVRLLGRKHISAWILTGLDRCLRYMGHNGNIVPYNELGQNLYKLHPQPDEETDEERIARYELIREQTAFGHPATKCLLYGEDQYSFGFLNFHAIDQDDWDSMMQKFRENNREISESTLYKDAILNNAIAEWDDTTKLRYANFTETHYSTYTKTRYRKGYNGGLIQAWWDTVAKCGVIGDLAKDKYCDKFFSYSTHT